METGSLEMPITFGDIIWKYKHVAILSGEVTDSLGVLIYECQLCNALVVDRISHAEYHLLKGEKPAE